MHIHPPGHILYDKYRIECTLDIGGQSVVYRAHQLGIGREVAIKIVRTDQSPKVMDTLIKRFAREAKLLGQLRDPHTITLHDFGTGPDGSLYMVCEFIPGRDLKQVLLEDGALSADRVASILIQIMKPLKEAHSKGILHRDIKPANIMLSEFDGQPDFVKVLDFGIAKIMEETTKLTGVNSVVGTPRYIAPEAIRRLELTPSYDLYSAGMIAYNLLTAEHPLANFAIKDMLLEIANGPDYKLPPDVNISEGFRDIIHNMLRKDRRRRYQSARDVIEALEALESFTRSSSAQAAAPAPQAEPLPSTQHEAPRFAATRQMHAVRPRTPHEDIQSPPVRDTASSPQLPEHTKPMVDTIAHQQDAKERPAVTATPSEPSKDKSKPSSYERNIPKGLEPSRTMMGQSATTTGAHTSVNHHTTSKIVIDSALPTERKQADPPSIGTLATIGPAVTHNVQQAARSTTIEIGAVNASQYGHLIAKQHAQPTPNRTLFLLAGAIILSIFVVAVIILVLAIVHLSQRM